MTHEVEFVDDRHFKVGSTKYYSTWPIDTAPDDHLPVMKPRALVERLAALLGSVRPEIIVELGIRGGGSTALIAQLARPSRLVAVEIAELPVVALRNFIATHRLEEVVRPQYGVDQADREHLAAVLDAELGARPIDLVFDDASHRIAETRSSFETLFPRIRPGGWSFVLEDWNSYHALADRLTRTLRAEPEGELAHRLTEALEGDVAVSAERPLSDLVIELLLACAARDEAIESVTIDAQWVVVRRGPAELDHRTFRLSQRYEDHFGQTSAGR